MATRQVTAKKTSRRNLRERIVDVLSSEIAFDTDAIVFAPIEGAMRKHLGLTYAQVDDVLHDARVEIGRLVDEATGDAIDFAVEALVEELGP
jgi:hypothetical protein